MRSSSRYRSTIKYSYNVFDRIKKFGRVVFGAFVVLYEVIERRFLFMMVAIQF